MLAAIALMPEDKELKYFHVSFLYANSSYIQLNWCQNIIDSVNALWFYYEAFEPRHDKTNKMSVRPAKTQISLGSKD